MTTPHRHAAPSTWWTRIADVLHRMITKRRPARAVGAHVYTWRGPGDASVMAAGLTARVRGERLERAALALLRTECERMATLLGGARRGHADATRNASLRTALRRDTARALHRVKAAARVPARSRFSAAPARFMTVSRATRTAVRTAGREAVAVAARTARQVGAHRHVGAATRAGHDLAARALARIKSYERTRAVGENSIWTTPRGLPA